MLRCASYGHIDARYANWIALVPRPLTIEIPHGDFTDDIPHGKRWVDPLLVKHQSRSGDQKKPGFWVFFSLPAYRVITCKVRHGQIEFNSVAPRPSFVQQGMARMRMLVLALGH